MAKINYILVSSLLFILSICTNGKDNVTSQTQTEPSPSASQSEISKYQSKVVLRSESQLKSAPIQSKSKQNSIPPTASQSEVKPSTSQYKSTAPVPSRSDITTVFTGTILSSLVNRATNVTQTSIIKPTSRQTDVLSTKSRFESSFSSRHHGLIHSFSSTFHQKNESEFFTTRTSMVPKIMTSRKISSKISDQINTTTMSHLMKSSIFVSSSLQIKHTASTSVSSLPTLSTGTIDHMTTVPSISNKHTQSAFVSRISSSHAKLGGLSSYSSYATVESRTASSQRNENKTQSSSVDASKSTQIQKTTSLNQRSTLLPGEFTSSSAYYQGHSTRIQPSPTGSSRTSLVVSSNVVTSFDYDYTITLKVEGNCIVLNDDKFKEEFFSILQKQLQEDFGMNAKVVIDQNYRCGSVLLNYTVSSSLEVSRFQNKLSRNQNVTFQVNGTSFTRVQEDIVKVVDKTASKSSAIITTQPPTTTKTVKTNKKNLTVLYATIFSVVGFVLIVIIIVIVIGCRKNGNVLKSKRSYELGRFDHTSTNKAAVNMYGEEPIIKDATDSDSRPNDDLSPTWDIPKLEIDDEKSALNASKANGVENKALENEDDDE